MCAITTYYVVVTVEFLIVTFVFSNVYVQYMKSLVCIVAMFSFCNYCFACYTTYYDDTYLPQAIKVKQCVLLSCLKNINFNFIEMHICTIEELKAYYTK